MFRNAREDIDRYRFMGGDARWWVVELVLSLDFRGLWAVLDYRARRWIKTEVRTPVIRQLLRLLAFFSQLCVETVTGVAISADADIGKGLYIGHSGCIVVGLNVKMGEYCNLSHDVTIGRAGRGEKFGFPTVGSRVYIAPGARIIGPVTIGDDVAIGANAVVTRDLPDRAVAVGVPAKVISYRGSTGFVKYRRKD